MILCFLFVDCTRTLVQNNENSNREMDYKDKIISELDTMRKKELQDKQPFKARAYAKVISELKALQGPVQTVDNVKGIPGIGEKIHAKIVEILESGELLAAKVVREERQFNILDELLGIHGIGPTKARELVSKHKIKSIDDLRERARDDPKILNDVQRLGLKYYDDISKRIPRKEMQEHERVALGIIKSVSPEFEAMVVGSYRRQLADSGDIDVILKLPKTTSARASGELFKGVVDKMRDDGYIVDILAKGSKKCMAVVRLGGTGGPGDATSKARRLDLLLTPEEEYGYALLYFTGSGPFNVVMRQHALEMGYTLNEHRMKVLDDFTPKPTDVPALLTERDIFAFLNVPFIEPKDRTPEEFERVMKGMVRTVGMQEPAAPAAVPQKKVRGRPKKA